MQSLAVLQLFRKVPIADHVTALEDFLLASRPGDARALVAVGG